MTWAHTKETGSGELRFGIVIEGWPDSWVSDESITYSHDGETVRVGLSADGIVIQDRVIMHEARCEQGGITFKIRPAHYAQEGASQWTDDPTASFSRQAKPVAVAEENLADTAVLAPDLVGGVELTPDTVYWIGSEAILMDAAWPDIAERGHFSSIDQAHFVPSEPTDGSLYIWDYPPTMEGRRVKLYVWGGGDEGSDEGTLIWRGIVRRPPVLDRDGGTWQIQCSGIVDVLKQRLAGDIKSAKVVGIYHHASCAIKIEARYDANSADAPTMVVGWDVDEAALFDRVNTALATVLADIGADTFVESCRLTRSADHGLRLEMRTTGTGAEELVIWLSSPIIGGVNTFNDRWVDASTGEERNGGINDVLSVSTTYYSLLTRPHPEFFHPRIAGAWEPEEPMGAVNPLGYAFEIMMPLKRNTPAAFRGERWQSDDATEKADNPPWRLYVDQDFDGVEAVHIPGTDKPDSVFIVTDTGETADRGFWIDLEPWTLANPQGNKAILTAAINGHPSRGFMGFVDGGADIRARRSYGQGTVADFMAAIQLQAPMFGNRADTPFVTTEDTSVWALANGGHGVSQLLALREYVFFGPVPLDAMLLEEAKLVNHFLRIDGDGLIDLAPMPALTPTSPVSGARIIAANDIVTPADGYGAIPTWEPMRDGRITTVKYQTVYDSITDEWIDPPLVFMDGMAVSLSKTRGKAVSEIKPYSSAVLVSTLFGFDLADGAVQQMALRYLALFARDYQYVTVCVPFTKFDILCGDIVSLTSQHVPDGAGKRGISGVRGVVVERKWPMDPQAANYGELTIMLVQGAVSGYAPSGFVTAQVNTAGTTWSLTLSTAFAANQAWSTNGDGLILEHFADGDFIRLVQGDDFTPTIVTGVISGSPNVAAGTCTVVLDGAWVPGADSWLLEFQEDTDGDHATDAQNKYAYVANETGQLQHDAFARMFA